MKTTKAALILGAAKPLPVRRILHPTDLSDASRPALTVAIQLARQNRADLLLAHALPPPTPIYEIEAPQKAAAEKNLETWVETLRLQGVKAKRVLIKGTRPVSRNIVDCARFLDADLIVMGNHARRGFARLLKGSIAVHVLRDAPCPVLVVKNR